MAAKAVLEHITAEIQNATNAVLYANNDLHSPNFGAWIVHPVGPGKEYERLEDFERAYSLIDLNFSGIRWLMWN